MNSFCQIQSIFSDLQLNLQEEDVSTNWHGRAQPICSLSFSWNPKPCTRMIVNCPYLHSCRCVLRNSPFLQALLTLPQTLTGRLSPPRPRLNPQSRPPPGRPHHVPLMARGGPVLAQHTLQACHHGPDHVQPQAHHHRQGHSALQRASVSSE